MNVTYRPFTHADTQIVTELITSLYREDPGSRPMTSQKITRTLDALTDHPDRGSIVVLENGGKIIGYSLLINYWSNELGGNLLVMDELYIIDKYRGQGVGTAFIEHVISSNRGKAVALQLEVTANNVRARKLYVRLGFRPLPNDLLTLVLE